MAIPDFQTIMLPLLQFTADGQEHSIRDAVKHLADHFALTDEERKQLLPSGTQATFDNRANWAASKLRRAMLLEATRRGHFAITERGQKVLNEKPSLINLKYLKQFPEFVIFKAPYDEKQSEAASPVTVEEQTPEEATAVIDRVRLSWETASAAAYSIQVSSDGAAWTDIYSTQNGAGGRETIHFAPVAARHVRVLATRRATKFGYSLWSFEVFAAKK